MKKLFALVAVVMLACATVSAASTIFNETFSTRRASTYIDKTDKGYWPYANQWFTGYTTSDGKVEGNQYDYDYTDVASYTVSIRGKKLNNDEKSSVGLYFGANKAAEQNYVTFSTPAEFANQVLPEGAVLKFRICSTEEDGGDLSTMVIVFNQDTLQVPATTLGAKFQTSDVVVALPQAACQTLTFAFDNVPSQKFIPDFQIDLDAEQGIENVEAVKAEKFYRNGQLIIRKNGVEYNVLGAEVR